MDDSSPWWCEDIQWPLNSSMAAPPPKTGCDLKTTGTLSSQEEVSTRIRQSLSQTKPKPTFSKGFSRTLVRKDQYSKWKPLKVWRRVWAASPQAKMTTQPTTRGVSN